jgi:D-alanyl-D-alanine carboxypeptidase
VDAESGSYLAGKNADGRLPMGSTDKMMVALVGLDAVAAGEVDLDEEVVVSEEAASFATPSTATWQRSRRYSSAGLPTSASMKTLLALPSEGYDGSTGPR